MVITFAWALLQALTYCVRLNAELFSWADALAAAANSFVFPPEQQLFSALIGGCLKYENKEKPKTVPRLGPYLNYDMKIGPKPSPWSVKKSGFVGPGLKCKALAIGTDNVSVLCRVLCPHLMFPYLVCFLSLFNVIIS